MLGSPLTTATSRPPFIILLRLVLVGRCSPFTRVRMGYSSLAVGWRTRKGCLVQRDVLAVPKVRYRCKGLGAEGRYEAIGASSTIFYDSGPEIISSPYTYKVRQVPQWPAGNRSQHVPVDHQQGTELGISPTQITTVPHSSWMSEVRG